MKEKKTSVGTTTGDGVIASSYLVVTQNESFDQLNRFMGVHAYLPQVSSADDATTAAYTMGHPTKRTTRTAPDAYYSFEGRYCQ